MSSYYQINDGLLPSTSSASSGPAMANDVEYRLVNPEMYGFELGAMFDSYETLERNLAVYAAHTNIVAVKRQSVLLKPGMDQSITPEDIERCRYARVAFGCGLHPPSNRTGKKLPANHSERTCKFEMVFRYDEKAHALWMSAAKFNHSHLPDPTEIKARFDRLKRQEEQKQTLWKALDDVPHHEPLYEEVACCEKQHLKANRAAQSSPKPAIEFNEELEQHFRAYFEHITEVKQGAKRAAKAKPVVHDDQPVVYGVHEGYHQNAPSTSQNGYYNNVNFDQYNGYVQYPDSQNHLGQYYEGYEAYSQPLQQEPQPFVQHHYAVDQQQVQQVHYPYGGDVQYNIQYGPAQNLPVASGQQVQEVQQLGPGEFERRELQHFDKLVEQLQAGERQIGDRHNEDKVTMMGVDLENPLELAEDVDHEENLCNLADALGEAIDDADLSEFLVWPGAGLHEPVDVQQQPPQVQQVQQEPLMPAKRPRGRPRKTPEQEDKVRTVKNKVIKKRTRTAPDSPLSYEELMPNFINESVKSLMEKKKKQKEEKKEKKKMVLERNEEMEKNEMELDKEDDEEDKENNPFLYNF